MENILAINTAFKQANLALSASGQCFFCTLDSNAKHSENVLKAIDELLSKAGIDVQNLDVLAVVVGPGSFTGLRIGTSIAKGLGVANENLKFLTLSSLQFLAYIAVKSNMIDSDFVVALDALSQLVFMQKFSRDGTVQGEEHLASIDELKTCNLPIVSLDLDFPRVSITSEALLQFSQQMLSKKQFTNLHDVVPKYLRLSQAEASRLGTNAGE